MITLWTRSRGLENATRDAVTPRHVTVEHPQPMSQPRTADAVVTTGSLGRETEMLAMRLRTSRIFVLPEASEFLKSFVDSLPDPVLAGADMGNASHLAVK